MCRTDLDWDGLPVFVNERMNKLNKVVMLTEEPNYWADAGLRKIWNHTDEFNKKMQKKQFDQSHFHPWGIIKNLFRVLCWSYFQHYCKMIKMWLGVFCFGFLRCHWIKGLRTTGLLWTKEISFLLQNIKDVFTFILKGVQSFPFSNYIKKKPKSYHRGFKYTRIECYYAFAKCHIFIGFIELSSSSISIKCIEGLKW